MGKDTLLTEGAKALVSGKWLHNQCAEHLGFPSEAEVDAYYENLPEEDNDIFIREAMRDVAGSEIEFPDFPKAQEIVSKLSVLQKKIEAEMFNLFVFLEVGVTDVSADYLCSDCPYEVRVNGKTVSFQITYEEAVSTVLDIIFTCRQVVRCRDCVHWSAETDDGKSHSCECDALLRPGTFFCANGYRR